MINILGSTEPLCPYVSVPVHMFVYLSVCMYYVYNYASIYIIIQYFVYIIYTFTRSPACLVANPLECSRLCCIVIGFLPTLFSLFM